MTLPFFLHQTTRSNQRRKQDQALKCAINIQHGSMITFRPLCVGVTASHIMPITPENFGYDSGFGRGQGDTL